jgi:O-acetyl-ADP-ribose deacetylase (regulator of RNase III)
MIEFTHGDMFGVDADIRVNTVNCVGVMGKGVALAFRNRYPEMFREYKVACRDGQVQPGRLFVWHNLANDWVVNFPTKRDWKEKSRYEDIESGLMALCEYLSDKGEVTMTLPALGCGHGGLDWQIVSRMIAEHLGDLAARILVFAPNDSRANDEQSIVDMAADSSELSEVGFERMNGPRLLYVKGNRSRLDLPWVALMPSKVPSEKEQVALQNFALQLAALPSPPSVALINSSAASLEVARNLADHGIHVVLILPYGCLTKKSIFRQKWASKLTFLSAAGPNDHWSRQTFARSLDVMRTGACSVLISDPDGDWLTDRILSGWSTRAIFYFRSSRRSETIQRLLATHASAVKVGPTGAPDVSDLALAAR